MDVSRRTLIVGGTSAIVGAGVGAGVAGFVAADRTGPTLWQRGDRSGAPRVGGLHLQYGADAASEVVVSWHTAAAVNNPRVMVGTPDDGVGRTVAAETVTYRDAASRTEIRVHHTRLDRPRPGHRLRLRRRARRRQSRSGHRADGAARPRPAAFHQLRRPVHPDAGRHGRAARSAATTSDRPRRVTSPPRSNAPRRCSTWSTATCATPTCPTTASGRGRTGSRTIPGPRATGRGCLRRATTRTSWATARSATAPTRPTSRCRTPAQIRSCEGCGTRSPRDRSG